MWPFTHKVCDEEPPKVPEKRNIHSTDDLITRAENLVWSLGFRGDIDHLVLAVFKVLKKYEELDERNKKGT